MSMVVIGVVLIVLIVSVVSLAAWFSLSNPENKIVDIVHQHITPQEYQMHYASREHLLLDVRTAEEFRTGHIPGAVNIARHELPQQMITLPKERPIIIYCRSGARSNSAAQVLTQAGFENIYDLGGISQWREQGLPVKA